MGLRVWLCGQALDRESGIKQQNMTWYVSWGEKGSRIESSAIPIPTNPISNVELGLFQNWQQIQNLIFEID